VTYVVAHRRKYLKVGMIEMVALTRGCLKANGGSPYVVASGKNRNRKKSPDSSFRGEIKATFACRSASGELPALALARVVPSGSLEFLAHFVGEGFGSYHGSISPKTEQPALELSGVGQHKLNNN